MLALDECLTAEAIRANLSGGRVAVMCRLTSDDIATSLGISARTVKPDWQMAKFWLYI
jgi:ECF sigma factor